MADLLDQPNLKGDINLHKVSFGVRCNPEMLSRLRFPSSSRCRFINNLQEVHESGVATHVSPAAVCQPDESGGPNSVGSDKTLSLQKHGCKLAGTLLNVLTSKFHAVLPCNFYAFVYYKFCNN